MGNYGLQPGAVNAKLTGLIAAGSPYRVVPVCGPAGSGKTRSIAATLARSDVPRAHVRARRYHATLEPFARALVDALAPVAPSLRMGFGGAASTARRSVAPATVLGDWLAERLGTTPAMIALDDLHLIDDSPAVRDFIVRAIARCGPEIRWILAARDTHMWPLATWLATSVACVPLVYALDPSTASSETAGLAVAAWCSALDGAQSAVVRTLALLPAFDEAIVSGIAGANEALAAIAKAFPFARSGDRFTSSFGEIVLASTAHVDADAVRISRDVMMGAPPSTRLQFFTEIDARETILESLERDGFALLDDDLGDIVQAAVERLSHDERRTSAIAVALEAKREMELGRHDVGEAWYLHAASIARDESDRTRVELAHAADLLRRSRVDAIEMLEAIALRSVSPSFDAMALATLGAAYAASERWELARENIATALARVDGWPEHQHASVRAVVYRQAAYVTLRDGDARAAAALARQAIAFAELCTADDVVAAALSVLVVVAISHADDGDEALDLLAQLERRSERLGNAYLLRYSRLAQLDEYGERAMWSHVDTIETLLAQQELENDARHTDETLVRTRALRKAAAGDFLGALRLLQAVADNASDPELLALRHAEMATYAAAGGDIAWAARAIGRAAAALRFLCAPTENALVVRTTLHVALAEVLIGDADGAALRLDEIEQATEAFPRMRAFAQAIRSVLDFGRKRTDNTCMTMLDDLGVLHASGLGGVASVIGALPLARVARPAS